MFHNCFYLTLITLVVDGIFVENSKKEYFNGKPTDVKDNTFHEFRFRVTKPQKQTNLDHKTVKEVRGHHQLLLKLQKTIRTEWSRPTKIVSRGPFETAGPKALRPRKPETDPQTKIYWVPPSQRASQREKKKFQKSWISVKHRQSKENNLVTPYSHRANQWGSSNSTGVFKSQVRVPHNHNPVYTGITDYRNIVEKYKSFREQSLTNQNKTFDYGINEYLEIKNLKNLGEIENEKNLKSVI